MAVSGSLMFMERRWSQTSDRLASFVLAISSPPIVSDAMCVRACVCVCMCVCVHVCLCDPGRK